MATECVHGRRLDEECRQCRNWYAHVKDAISNYEPAKKTKEDARFDEVLAQVGLKMPAVLEGEAGD